MKWLARCTALVLIISFVATAPVPLGAATTDTFRDEFNAISYSGDDSVGGSWASAWWDSEDQDETAGDVTVDSDGTEDFVLRFNSNGSGQYAERTADLSTYDTATLSFDYRRKNTDATFVFKVWASANGPGGPFTEIFAIATGDDAVYVGSGNLDLTPYRSPTTTIRFSYEAGALGAGKDFYVDNVEISAFAGNLAPVAVDDSDFTLVNTPITVDVLANDSDPDLDPLSVTAVTSGGNGGVTSTPGDVTYTPNPGWTGVDTFTYTIWDGAEFDTATVTVTVVDQIIYRDEFNAQVYNGNDGTVPWSSDWAASGASGPLVGERRVDADGAELYVLMFDYSTPGEYVERSADLSVLGSAELTFDYRQQFMTPATGFEVQVSEDGSVWNTVWSMWGSGTDASYVPVSVDLAAYSGAPTIIRFVHITGTPANFIFHIDNVQIAEAAPSNQPPVAVDDDSSTAPNTPVTIDVLGNDSDPDLDPLLVDSVTQGAHGTVVNNGTDVTYTPNLFWRGLDTFTYTATDGNGGFDTATVTVGVGGVCYLVGDGGGADALTLVNLGSGFETLVGATGTSGITAAALHPLSDTLYAALPGQLGTVDVVTGAFTPTAGPFGGGFDNIQAIAFNTDGSLFAFHHRSGPKDLLIRVDPSTGAFIPDAFGPGVDSVSLDSNLPAQKSVLGIDINDFGHMYGVTSNDGPDHTIQWIDKNSGSAFAVWGASATVDVSMDATGRFWMLSPTGNLSEPFGTSIALSELAGYQAVACEGGLANQSPSATGDADTTAEDVAVTVDVLANDSDADLDPLVVDAVTDGLNGSVTNSGTDVTYTPNPDWYGIDTFSYTVSDGNGGFASAQVTVTVTAQPDPPVGVDDADSTVEDTAVTVDVLANDTDVDLDVLSVSAVTQGSNGSVVNNVSNVTYTPTADWSGTDTFTYTISDGNGGFDTATVTVTVAAANDDPTAVDDSDTTAEDTAVTVDVLANDSDPESDPLSVDSVTQGTSGSVVNNGTDVTYTPDPDWNGIDSFTYTVTDGNGGFDTATVTVIVDPVNDDPVAAADTKIVDEDSSETIPVLGNDSDIDGDPLTITGVIDGSNGTVVNNGTNVTYIPNPDWSGIDTFMYTISDGNGGSASALVTVTVVSVNDDPFGVADSATTFEDTPVGVDVLANDSDVDSSALTVAAVSNGANGTVVTDGVTVTYTPDPDWFGTDTFTYRVSDDLGGWCETDVTVLVRPVNDDPIAFDDIATTPRDTSVYIWVLDNDTDVDPDTLSVSGFTNGANGSVVNNTIKVTYTPDPGWTGTDTFTYTVSDGSGGFDTATVTVTVTAGPNRPPVAKDDTKTSDEDTPVAIAVLANDSDPDGDAVTVSAVNQGAHGSVTKTATSVTYTPNKNWTGVDSFSYSISDGRGGTATAAVVITVKPVNDPPTAKDDSTSTPASTDVKIAVLANDSDVDGDPLTVATITQGSHGVTTTDGSTVRYSPSPGWSGTDSFTYTITDGHGGSDTAKVLVYVGSVNRPPTISVTGDTSVAEDDRLALEISVVDPDGDRVDISANGLPDWAGMVDHGDGRATISGTPGFDADPSSEITVSASDGTVTARITVTINVVDVNRAPLIRPITFSGVNDDGSFSFVIAAADPDGDPISISASGLPAWATLTDRGDGTATISSSGVPDDAVGSFSVMVAVSDGQATVTSSLARAIIDLRLGLPPELTHQVLGTDGADTLVATALKPRVGTPDPLGAHLTPREGLLVAFGSAVETMKNQVIPAVILGVVMAWMLMIGVGRVKEEEEPEAA